MTPSERYPRRVLVVGSASTGRVVRAAQDHRVRALDDVIFTVITDGHRRAAT